MAVYPIGRPRRDARRRSPVKIFHCTHCQHLVFFENTACVNCGRRLAYLPDCGQVGALDPAGDSLWQHAGAAKTARFYRLCEHSAGQALCNWAVVADDPNRQCISCRLTRVIPDLGHAEHARAWSRLEAAKRRLVYTILELGLPLVSRVEDPQRGLAFDFLANLVSAKPVFTGHENGVITVNVAEADDAQREERRCQLHEPYRTLLGHLRHEIGHYYWDRLVRDSGRLESFRNLFGDERGDYQAALDRHYNSGARADWAGSFISAYAGAHPWEDFAESWAHYFHMMDTLEIAAACGLSLCPARNDEPVLAIDGRHRYDTFGQIAQDWFSVTYILNNLNRGLGLADAYPFVLSTPVLEKLQFVHETIRESRLAMQDSATQDSAQQDPEPKLPPPDPEPDYPRPPGPDPDEPGPDLIDPGRDPEPVEAGA